MKAKILAYLADHCVTWVIELSILSIIGFVTISETRKTAEQTREMLTAITAFASDRSEAVSSAIDSLSSEAQNFEIDGTLDLGDVDVNLDALESALDRFFPSKPEEKE